MKNGDASFYNDADLDKFKTKFSKTIFDGMKIVNDDGREINIVGLDNIYYSDIMTPPSILTYNGKYVYTKNVIRTGNIIHEIGAHLNSLDIELQHFNWYKNNFGAFNFYEQGSLHEKMFLQLKDLFGTLYEKN